MHIDINRGIIYLRFWRNSILLFNLHTLEALAKGDDKKLVWILYKWNRDKDIIQRYKDKYTLSKPLGPGSSYLINPSPIFKDKRTEPQYLAQYIKLAARRDLTLYKLYGLKSLLRSYFIDLNIENIKHNPLLEITPTEINFKYE